MPAVKTAWILLDTELVSVAAGGTVMPYGFETFQQLSNIPDAEYPADGICALADLPDSSVKDATPPHPLFNRTTFKEREAFRTFVGTARAASSATRLEGGKAFTKAGAAAYRKVLATFFQRAGGINDALDRWCEEHDELPWSRYKLHRQPWPEDVSRAPYLDTPSLIGSKGGRGHKNFDDSAMAFVRNQGQLIQFLFGDDGLNEDLVETPEAMTLAKSLLALTWERRTQTGKKAIEKADDAETAFTEAVADIHSLAENTTQDVKAIRKAYTAMMNAAKTHVEALRVLPMKDAKELAKTEKTIEEARVLFETLKGEGASSRPSF